MSEAAPPRGQPSNAVAAERIAGGALAAIVAGGLAFVLSTAYQIAVARRLGVVGFGVFVLALSIADILAQGSDLGLSYGVLRFGGIAWGLRDHGQLRSVIRRSLASAFCSGLTIAAVLVAGSRPLTQLFGKPDLAGTLVPLALSLPFTATAEVARAGLRSMGRALPSIVSAAVLTPVVRLGLGLVSLAIVADPEAVAMGYTATEVVVFVVTLAMVWRRMPPAGSSTMRPGLFRYSVPMSLNRMLLYVNNQTEIFVLGVLRPAGSLGIFGVARRLSILMSALLTSVTVVFNPMIADLHHRDQGQELEQLFKTSTRWLFTVGLPVCLMESLFARDILHLFGREFAAGASALTILAVGQLVNVGTGTVDAMLAMVGRARLSLLNSLLFLGLSLALDFVLIPPWGLVGAAIANSSAVVVVNVLRLIQVRVLLEMTPYDRRFLRPALAGLLAGAGAWAIPLPHLFHGSGLVLGGGLLLGIYAMLLGIFGIDPIDREIGAALWARLRRGRLDDRASGQAALLAGSDGHGRALDP
jgi:O-antigen/teichoic acid export membrane protein